MNFRETVKSYAKAKEWKAILLFLFPIHRVVGQDGKVRWFLMLPHWRRWRDEAGEPHWVFSMHSVNRWKA